MAEEVFDLALSSNNFPRENECNNDRGRFVIDVWFNTTAQPKFRKEGVENTEQKSDSGTQGDQGIHIRLPVFGLLESIDEKATTEPK